MLTVLPKNTATWADLTAELTIWAGSGRKAAFWWRDDDATRPSEPLEKLLKLGKFSPLALAVIPAGASSDLAEVLAGAENVSVLQHGFRHANHAPPACKKSEFGQHRPVNRMLRDADDGKARLEELFGAQFQPIFVPPWNRIADTLPAKLASRGFRGVSCYGKRWCHSPGRFDCHVDLIDWRGSREFIGTETALENIIRQLTDRRINASPETDPIGILTHHLDHDAGCWGFLETFLEVIEDHPAAEWQPVNKAALV